MHPMEPSSTAGGSRKDQRCPLFARLKCAIHRTEGVYSLRIVCIGEISDLPSSRATFVPLPRSRVWRSAFDSVIASSFAWRSAFHYNSLGPGGQNPCAVGKPAPTGLTITLSPASRTLPRRRAMSGFPRGKLDFYASLKEECAYQKFESRQEARGVIFEYIELWYNRQRYHSRLGYMSPVEFEMRSGH